MSSQQTFPGGFAGQLPPADVLQQQGWRPLLFDEMVAGGESLSDVALDKRQASVTPDDPAMMLYTSGTTGSPKGALLTHRSLLNNARFVAQRWGVNQDAAMCVLVPFFHAMGGVAGTIGALLVACRLHPLLAFDALKALQVISRERCTFLSGTPTMITALMQHPDVSSFDLLSLKLICRGYLVMAGYYHMPERTAEAIDAEGWLHTGDLATMDARGSVTIVGRLKDMVIRGGENLFRVRLKSSSCVIPKSLTYRS